MGLETSGARNGKIYYNHIFTRTELDFLIQQIRETDNFTDKEKEIFEEKIIQELASAKYIPLKDNEISPSLIHNFENKDYAFIRRNIKILREAIEKNYMVEFKMLKMNKEKQIEFAKEEEYIISPYMLLYYNGDYWLLANCQRERLYNEEYNYKFSSGVTLYRVDKMSRVSFFEQDYKKKKRRFPYHTERKLEEWNARVCFLHKGEFAKGSRFEPIPEIAFEILWDKFPKKERNDYSFIYDSFGKNFEVKNNVVYVKASPEFFERWAMGYADRIIVTEDTPASVIVRENLKIKIKEIHSLYN